MIAAARKSEGIELRLHPRQGQLFQSEAREILFGGAAGGGKSYALRVALISWAHAIPKLQCYLFRRTYPELISNHVDGPTGLPTLLAPWIDSGYVKWKQNDNRFDFANGSSIILCHCQREGDRLKYQGAEIHVLAFDELTLFTDTIYRFLRSRVRMSGVVLPDWAKGRFPRVVATSNPGGIGHNWVKKTWRIGEIPGGRLWTAPGDDGGFSRQFIQSLLTDNPSLEGDNYEQRLAGLKDPRLVKAMLDGDWDIEAGGMFDDLYSADHHTKPLVRSIPRSWRVDRSYDWGSAKPWCVLWHAQADGETPAELDGGEQFCPPRGSVFTFHELYGWNGHENEGDRSTSSEHARRVKQMEARWAWSCNPGPADSSIFDIRDGRSIADEHKAEGVSWKPCAKGPGSRVNGWEVMRRMLVSAKSAEGAGWYVSESCSNLLRTLVGAPRDDKKPDDVDTEYEDHALDAARYRLAGMPPSKTIRKATFPAWG